MATVPTSLRVRRVINLEPLASQPTALRQRRALPQPQPTFMTANRNRSSGEISRRGCRRFTGTGRLGRRRPFAAGALVAVDGGAARLTGSGLSITEWNPVSGALPPFGAAAWQELFAKYQASPQYQLLNHGMSLSAFKFIFWWEWGHRQLGRFIGLVYLVGFV